MAEEKTSTLVRVVALGLVLMLALGAAGVHAASTVIADMVRRAPDVALAAPAPTALAEDAFTRPLPALPAARSESVTVAYASELAGVGGGHVAEAQVAFDNAWLIDGSRSYNNDLAATCAALSAAVNAQSSYGAPGGRAYAVEALGALGFCDVDVSAYEGRSRVVDEVANALSGSTDVAAYALARKELVASDGRVAGDVVLVGVRGTYGSEWLSNFNCALGPDAGEADHRGFARAADEARSALGAYLERHGLDQRTTHVLLFGHSRGGAVVNLLAADLIDEGSYAGVHAYTFAAPNSTRSPERANKAYAGIFNVVNPADAVPSLPLAAWGYGAYGMTVELPAREHVAYRAAYNHMSAARSALTRCEVVGDRRESPLPADVLEACASALARVSEGSGGAAALAQAAGALASIDVTSALTAHSPDTYLAWLQTANPATFTFKTR
ncbi:MULTISPECIES: lipase family protein [unclassified Adlercreutzia]|uniref:lipase family protein n=1 Tax=unclassified Adlercreutzia TaxID=2636013 RepID=UPI0013EE06E7|nr:MULTISPECIES: lipase family protein [unclassified Adlercreutzia]